MTSTGGKFLHLVNWMVAVFLTFAWMTQWDESSPLPVRASLTVTAWNGSATLNEVRHEIEIYAQKHHITFAQEVAGFAQRHAVRDLYLVSGDPTVPGADWLAGKYRDFSQSVTTRVHPFAELDNRTPVGRYDVFGDAAKAEQLRNFFAGLGLSADVDQVHRWSNLPASVLLALAMLIFFSVVVVGATVLSEVKAYGVGRLHGLSYGRLLLADLRAGATAWAMTGAVAGAVALVIAAAYNGLAAFGMFAVRALAIDLLLTAAAFIANALMLLAIMQVQIQAALKGALPSRTASTMAFALRVVAVLITVGSVATTLHLVGDLVSRERSHDAYARLGNTATLSLGNAYTLDEQTRLATTVGGWLRIQDRSGQVLLAGQTLLQSADPLLNGRPVLYVNDVFLADQPVRLAGGGNYAVGSTESGLDVLIPVEWWDRRDRVVTDLGADTLLRKDADSRRHPVEIANGQQFFTYSVPSAAARPAGPPSSDAANVTDPVIVVLPSTQGLLSDDGYTAFASSGQVLFRDPTVVKDAVADDQRLRTYIRAVAPVAEHAATEMQTVERQLRLAVLTVVIGMLILLITGIGVVLLHARRNTELIFARHVNGWRFSATHRSLLMVEAIMIAVLVGVLPYQVWTQNRELAVYRQMGAPVPAGVGTVGGAQWAAIAVLATVMIGGVLAALARTHRQVIHDGANEA